MARATVGGLSIGYEVVGDEGARPWAITPGARDARDTPGLREMASDLAERGNRILLWDRPNTGESDVCFEGSSESVIQADALAASEPQQQRQASGIDQCPVYRQPWLGVMPWSGRPSQGEDSSNDCLRYHSKSCAREQHQCRAAPCQRRRFPPPKESLVGIRIHERDSGSLVEISTREAQGMLDAPCLAPRMSAARPSALRWQFMDYARSIRLFGRSIHCVSRNSSTSRTKSSGSSMNGRWPLRSNTTKRERGMA